MDKSDSPIGKALAECSDEGPAVFCVTNVHSDGNGGTVATGRLFSGKVQKGDKLHLVDALTETVGQASCHRYGLLPRRSEHDSSRQLGVFNFNR